MITGFPFDLHEIPGKGFELTTESGTFFAQKLVFATGALSKLPDQFGLLTKVNKDTRCGVRVDLEGHSNNQAVDKAVAIYLNSDYQACCTPVGHNKVTISIMTDSNNAKLLSGTELKNTINEIQNEIGLEMSILILF